MSDDLYSILTRGSGNNVTSLLEIEPDGEVEVETPDSYETWYTNADSTLLYNEELEDNGLIEKKPINGSQAKTIYIPSSLKNTSQLLEPLSHQKTRYSAIQMTTTD